MTRASALPLPRQMAAVRPLRRRVAVEEPPSLRHCPASGTALRAQPLVAARAAPASRTALAYPFARLVLEAVAEMTVLLRAEGRPGPLQAERPRRGANLHRPNSFGGLGLGGQFGLDNRLVLAGCYHWLWRWGGHLCGSWPTRCGCFWALLGSRYCCRVLWRWLVLALFHRLTLEFEPNKHAFAEVANLLRAELSTGTRTAANLHHANLHPLAVRSKVLVAGWRKWTVGLLRACG